MAYSKKEAPNCDWCRYARSCFYDLIGTKEAKKAWREITAVKQTLALYNISFIAYKDPLPFVKSCRSVTGTRN